MSKHLSQIGLTEHNARINRLALHLSPRSKIKWSEQGIHTELVALLPLIRHQLETTALFPVSQNADFLNPRHKLFGPDVASAFPRAAEDIRQAHRCVAFRAPAASIYHSMMVLEHGLKAFAAKLKVHIKPQRSTWGPIIDDIEQEVTARLAATSKPPPGTKSKTPAAAAKNRKYLQACQDAAIELRFFKNVWRDHIAHGGGTYTQEEAERVLQHVGMFMKVLAKDLAIKQVKP